MSAEVWTFKGHVHGKLISVITPGPERAPPPCPHYENCGGCSLQHLSNESYTRCKLDLLMAPLQAHGLGGVGESVLKSLISAPLNSRRRVNWKFKRLRASLALGYHRPKSHEIIPITSCLLLTPALEALLDPLRGFLFDFVTQGMTGDVYLLESESGIDLVLSIDGRIPLSLEEREILGEFHAALSLARLQVVISGSQEFLMESRPPRVKFAGIPVSVEAGCFLQSSKYSDDVMASFLKECFEGEKSLKIMDLFCGRGTLTLPLVKMGHKVTAIDSDKAAGEALYGASHGIGSLILKNRNLFTSPVTMSEFKGYDAVVLDPPRAGAKDQVEEIAKSSVSQVVMISCNPQTFARDAKILVDSGFHMVTLVPFDQFLYSPHLEVMAKFLRP